MVSGPTSDQSLGLRVGDVVEVRSEQEILATLDHEGRLDGLPFMPEMLPFCGQRFRVHRRADKTCDPVTTTRGGHIRRMHDTVHLEGLRCDGAAHGGCQAQCLMYWKEAWLRRDDGSPTARPGSNGADQRRTLPLAPVTTRATLEHHTRKHDGAPDSSPTFSCQATEVIGASTVLPWWEPTQYVRDLRSGNVRIGELLVGLLILLFNKMQAANEIFFPRFRLIRGGRRYPFYEGKLEKKTPQGTLDLQPGELVRIKSKEQIEATLNQDSENRGLRFGLEMVRYCGREASVVQRVDQIIDESSGKMIKMKNPCIILEDIICTGECFQMCPRSMYPYWREIWLERIDATDTSPRLAYHDANGG